MVDEKSFPKTIILSILFAFIISFAGSLVIKAAKGSLADSIIYAIVPDFAFEDKSGDIFSSRQMEGRVWIVDFIFTNCQGACPIMNGHMSKLYQLYAHSDKVHFLSISVDPERDTVEVLQQYAAKQGVGDDRWTFCRGPIDKVIAVCEQGFLLPAENLPMGHTTKFAVVDDKMQIRGYYDALVDAEIEKLKTQVRELVRKM